MNAIDILLVEVNEGDTLLTTEALREGNVVNTLNVVKDGLEALEIIEKEESTPIQFPKNN